MSRGKLSPSFQWHGVVVLVFLGILVGCNQTDPNKPQLVVTTVEGPGNSDLFFEYRSGETVATAKMQYVCNSPTDYEALFGNLSSIYEAITGASPDDPASIQTVESILHVMKQQGWRIVEDVSEESENGRATTKIVRTIRFQRAG